MLQPNRSIRKLRGFAPPGNVPLIVPVLVFRSICTVELDREIAVLTHDGLEAPLLRLFRPARAAPAKEFLTA